MIKRYLLALGVALVVVVADLLTKRYAAIEFAANPVELIPGFFGFTYLENFGGAFGFFQNGGTVIGVAAILVSLIVVAAIAFERPTAETVILGLVLGGAIGNLVDRVARGPGLIDGGVIDWIELWFIPTFNLADTSVTVAVALLLIQAWRNN